MLSPDHPTQRTSFEAVPLGQQMQNAEALLNSGLDIDDLEREILFLERGNEEEDPGGPYRD